MNPHRIQVIDSHTAGEPTRVVIGGGPELGVGTVAERRERFQREFDHFRSAIVNEPRGSDVVVGAILLPASDPTCAAGVIFFNNVGYLGMCGHGMIGVVLTLGHLGRLGAGTHRLETPVGVVSAEYDGKHTVAIENVPSYRYRKGVAVEVPGFGRVVGDVAWGGNWFFLVNEHGQSLELANVEVLTDYTWKIRAALAGQGITGADGAEIDHIELFAPIGPVFEGVREVRSGSTPSPPAPLPLSTGGEGRKSADSRNFVLCPGKAYDRSPCGTGTSAKIACLIADGKLKPGEVWRQESIIGSCFEAWGTPSAVTPGPSPGGRGETVVIPHIRGEAYVVAESTLVFDEADPFCWGIRGDASSKRR